ncbi:MAG: acyl-CoA dehydrogenase family protein [Deltaproteobacteria bacterium]|nr:acyl-CoA dehydrogenase family protein [Deltaproteobacteria bacterium]
MNFDLTEDQLAIRNVARDFATREVEPQAAKLDKTGTWPTDLVRKMGELGFMGVAIPGEWGGAGMDAVSYALAMFEISRACASTGVIMSVNNSLFCDPVMKWGNDQQKTEYLKPCAAGDKLGCFALTEPMSGSDAQTMVTAVEKSGSNYILNGSKNFITCGTEADFMIVFAGSARDGGKLKHHALLFPTNLPGITKAPADEKLGIHAAHSCTLYFENVKLDDSHLLGPAHQGFKVAMVTLDGGRIGIAAQAVGIARAAFDKAVAYAKERKAFGGPIANLQAIQFMLADMKVKLDVAEMLTLRAAWLKDNGRKHNLEAAEAKLFASEAATEIAHKAIQIHGGYGYTVEYGVERHYRDARITEIYEGTSEIQRLVIAASVLRD